MTASPTVLKAAPASARTLDAASRLDTLLAQLAGLARCVEAMGENPDCDAHKSSGYYTVGWVMSDLAAQAQDTARLMRAST